MSELQNRLERLLLRLDCMGMRCEEAVTDALDAIRDGNIDTGLKIDRMDEFIDREEVDIEQECIRLLALYQPAAVDLRTICTIIKINNDLERIADLAAGMGRRVRHVVDDAVSLDKDELFEHLARTTADVLGRTVRLLSTLDVSVASKVIDADELIDDGYANLVSSVLDNENRHVGGAGPAMTIINIAKALERIGDLCTNIAEDVIFLKTGDIVRHSKPDHGDGG